MSGQRIKEKTASLRCRRHGCRDGGREEDEQTTGGWMVLMWLRHGSAGVALSPGTHAFLRQAVSKGHFACLLFVFQGGGKPTMPHGSTLLVSDISMGAVYARD